jgi:hypothetical protein
MVSQMYFKPTQPEATTADQPARPQLVGGDLPN